VVSSNVGLIIIKYNENTKLRKERDKRERETLIMVYKETLNFVRTT